MWLDCGLVTSRGGPRTGPRALVALLPLLVFCVFFFSVRFSASSVPSQALPSVGKSQLGHRGVLAHV